jgi:hypothetical protein
MKPELLIRFLKGFNRFLHVFLAVALVLASLMVLWEFVREVVSAVQQQKLAFGFLHALGTLFIVWTLSSLITAEINYVQSGLFHLKVFIEVAMITLLRQLILAPVHEATEVTGPGPSDDAVDLWRYGLVLAALLIVGIVHRLIGDPTIPEREDRT